MTKRDIQKDLKKHLESEVHGSKMGEFIRDIVYGGNDGIVTTFAVVAGATGAQFDPNIVIVLGLANLFADGTSMATGAFLAIKSEMDQYTRLRKEELQEIEDDPEIEAEEIRIAYKKKGFSGDKLDHIVGVITANKEIWADTMMQEEHGLTKDSADKPVMHGFITFCSFIVFGSIPLLPYLFSFKSSQFSTAIISTFIALVILGFTRSYVTRERLIRGPIEIVFVGALGAIVAYVVGVLFKGVTGVVL